MMQFKPKQLDTKTLLLNPNNYRFFDNPEYKKRLATRFHKEPVQEATLRLLERGHSYQLKALRNSILTNGYVPMERVVVVPYEHGEGNKYLVIEGNRRVAALKSLLRDSKVGVIDLTSEQKKSYQKIPAAILETGEMSLADAERVIMGIRHIAGPRDWGAYQQAQLIFELVEEQGMDFKGIADHLGLPRVEVGRRYRAMKGLRSMESDEEYAEAAKTEYYRLFHELVSTPKVRERFGWDHNMTCFEDEEKAREFYELIAPQDPDREPKLRTFADVRKLKLIIGQQEAEASLLDPDQLLNDALAVASTTAQKSDSPQLRSELTEFEIVLTNVGLDDLRGLTEEDIGKLEALLVLIQERIDDYQKLQS